MKIMLLALLFGAALWFLIKVIRTLIEMITDQWFDDLMD